MKNSTVKTYAVNFLKIAFVGALLFWMVSSGKIDLVHMKESFSDITIIIPAVVLWVLGPVIFGTLRWWLLLQGADLECSWMKAMKLQLIGFFFNTAMPGAVGGDIVKAIYIVKDQPKPSGKTSALLTVLLDRIVGLIGLFAMGVIAAIWNFQTLIQNPVTVSMMTGLAVVFTSSIIFLGLVFIPYPDAKDPFRRLLSKQVPGFSILLGIYDALRGYRKKPAILFGTIMISMVIQLLYMGFMGYIGTKLYPGQFDISLLPAVFPFGTLVTAIPIAPGGLGVGHAAFDKLFQMVGLPGGANVFNIYALSQLIMNLLCFIPYLMTMKNVRLSEMKEQSSNA